ncbi:MAG: hypothetical protein VB031_06720 [Eubacteriaceae bacterium]|nr:hypothetical protein [Eubacteriaceae bacterium]
MVIKEQQEKYLPLIEDERMAFIKKEHGRLRAVIGVEYWDHVTGDSRPFHQYIEEGKETDIVPDPYEITLAELAMLPKMTKKVERIGTYSYLDFFQMMPEDRERIDLLCRIYEALASGCECSKEDACRLEKGHDEYMKCKGTDPVKVIMAKD